MQPKARHLQFPKSSHLLLASTLLSATAMASPAIYEAETWLYWMPLESCSGPAITSLLEQSETSLVLQNEDAIQSILVGGVPVPLPTDRPLHQGTPADENNEPEFGGPWSWTPGAIAFPASPMLMVPNRSAVVTFLDATPIEYLTFVDGDHYKTEISGGAPAVRVFLRYDPRENPATLQLRCEYSLITAREPVQGAEGLAAGKPVWASGSAGIDVPTTLNTWTGALFLIGDAPSRYVLLPMVRLMMLRPATDDTPAEPKPQPYDINGDGTTEMVPFYVRPLGMKYPLPISSDLLPAPDNVAPETPAPTPPIPAEGYDAAAFGAYSVESQVILCAEPLASLPFTRHDAAWRVHGEAIALGWPDGIRIDKALPNSELISAPRITNTYLANASTNLQTTLFKLMARTQDARADAAPQGSPKHTQFGGGGFGGQANPSEAAPTNFAFSNVLGDFAEFNIPLAGHSIVADIQRGRHVIDYDVRGWGPFKRSQELVRDGGALSSTWVGPTHDPDRLRVDYYFALPYVQHHEDAPKTQNEAAALMQAHEFRYLYECHDGETICFASTIGPNDYVLVFVTVTRVPWDPQPAAVPPTVIKEITLDDLPNPALENGDQNKRSTSTLQNIEVHGEIRVRANWRSR